LTRVIIVRHGQSTYNLEKRIQGRCDASVLTEKGRADARAVATALQGMHFDACYCSPLRRARETADIVTGSLDNAPPPQVTDALLEVNLPDWEHLTKDEVRERHADAYRLWHERPHELAMTVNGQPYYPVRALFEQATQFWQELLAQHAGSTTLIVGHNGINRCLISSAIGMSPVYYQVLQQSNCCINVLNFSGTLGDTVQIESLNQTAHLGIPLPPPRQNRGVRMLLVRHGETDWNRASRFQGQIDIPLNDTGRAQGQQVGEFLKDVPLDFATSSPMRRPKETAECILQFHPDLALDLAPDLVEISHGLWEGKLEAEIEADFGELLQQWKTAPETVQMPEGENLHQVWVRAVRCWRDLIREEFIRSRDANEIRTGIVVAHDAINKSILCALLGLDPTHFWSVKQGNGAVSVIDYHDGLDSAPVLQSLNITSHLGSGVLDKTAAGAL